MTDKQEKADQLVVCYKSIHVNTFTLLVVKIASGRIKYKFENYQLWESPMLGFLNTYQNDFIVLNRDGIGFIPLGDQEKRALFNPDGTERMIHSLPSCKYLEIDKDNFLSFQMPKTGHMNRKVEVAEQQLNKMGTTYFDLIYSVTINEMSIHELVFMQSIFRCESCQKMSKLIELQPNPLIFFKSYMELDQSNMVQLLSFDSRIIKTLMAFEFSDYHKKNPVFYKMRYHVNGEARLLSALDVALEYNQVRAINLIIDYMVKFQNSFAYNFIFQDIFLKLLKKGISVGPLLQSKIFCYQFDVEQWPVVHPSNSYQIKPYNGSIFQLKYQYKNLFPELQNPRTDEKYYKIKYTLNLLPCTTYADGRMINMSELMAALEHTEEREIFRTKVVKDYFQFLWSTFAKHVHFFGSFVHLAYAALYFTYVVFVYLERDFRYRVSLCWLMLICLIYPLVYDFLQLRKIGALQYFKDPWNCLDQSHIWIGFLNIFNQRTTPDIQSKESIILMLLVLFFLLIKTFFFLRIFKRLSYLVTMIGHVVKHLQVFMLFFSLLLFMFGLAFTILDIGAFEFSNDLAVR